MRLKDPFTPGFGKSPLILAGRQDMVDEFDEAIVDGPGATSRAMLYTGARGTGKTVMLNEIGDVANQHGWLAVHETADEGFVTRLVGHLLPKLLSRIDPDARHTKATGVTTPIGGLDWTTVDTHIVTATLRGQLELLCTILREQGTGLLITLDEIHYRNAAELRGFFATLQHLIREDHEIAFAAAGLASEISDLLSDDVLTFLRRAERKVLGAVAYGEVERALRETITAGGRAIEPAALAQAARATGGYPFLIQLVGSHVWKQSKTDIITPADVDAGTAKAMTRLGSLVHEPALADLSPADRSYLLAMAHDNGPSNTSEIAARLGKDAQWGSVYRKRLIDAQMIQSTGHGLVTFTLPYMREFLRQHAALDAQIELAGGFGELPTTSW